MDILSLWMWSLVLSGAINVTIIQDIINIASKNGYSINPKDNTNIKSDSNNYKLILLAMLTPMVNLILSFTLSLIYVSNKEKIINTLIDTGFFVENIDYSEVFLKLIEEEILKKHVFKVFIDKKPGFIEFELDDSFTTINNAIGTNSAECLTNKELCDIAQTYWDKITELAIKIYGTKEIFINELKNNPELVEQLEFALKKINMIKAKFPEFNLDEYLNYLKTTIDNYDEINLEEEYLRNKKSNPKLVRKISKDETKK